MLPNLSIPCILIKDVGIYVKMKSFKTPVLILAGVMKLCINTSSLTIYYSA